VLVAAARRFVVLLVLAGVVTVAGSLVFGSLAGASVDRSISVGFYLVGCFFLVGGFFMGNRGPLRLRNPADGAPLVPFWGTRVVRWATPDEREEAINVSAIYVVLGLTLILIGVVADSRYRLF
jgi:predicted MFS family arabinose efflux permease